MELNQVYLKTAKGQEEIQSRIHKLPAYARRLLIMVDGRSTAADLISRLTMLGDVEAGARLVTNAGEALQEIVDVSVRTHRPEARAAA